MTTMMIDRMDLYNRVPAVQLDETFADSFMDVICKVAPAENAGSSSEPFPIPEFTKPQQLLLPKIHQKCRYFQEQQRPKSVTALATAKQAPKTLDELQANWYNQHIAPRQRTMEKKSATHTMNKNNKTSSGLCSEHSGLQSHLYALHIALRTAGSRAKVSLVRSVAHTTPRALRVRDSKGRTPLMVALSSRAPREVVLTLLEGFPQAANVPDRRRNLPVHLAIQKQYDMEVVRALVMSNPKGALEGKDFNGRTALDVALQVRGTTDVQEGDKLLDFLQGLAFERLEREALDVE